MGGSSNESSSSSRPLTGPERANVFSSAMQQLASAAPGMVTAHAGASTVETGPWGMQRTVPGKTSYELNAPTYETPAYADPGGYQGLNDGDYEKLQNSMLSGYTSGIDYAKKKDVGNVNQNLASRGIWSSGLADKAVADREAAYAPEYAKAGADATNARYQLQQQDLAGKNAFALQASGARNSWNANNAQQTYNSKWAPLNYLQGLWNGTGGAISSGSSGSFGFNL